MCPVNTTIIDQKLAKFIDTPLKIGRSLNVDLIFISLGDKNNENMTK